MMKKIIERLKGFTLIELLVVIAIIGILSSSVVVSTNEARKSARDVRRLEDLKQIANAMELYLDSNNRKFPDTLSELAPNFIAVVPKDPQTKIDYFYCSNGTASGTNDGTTFHIGAAMEKYNPTYFDADADLETDGCEGLSGNPSFNGYSESCSGTQKCSGENCDGCLDFSNLVMPGDVDSNPGDDTGGDNGNGNDQGNDNGNGGGNGNSNGNGGAGNTDTNPPTAPAGFNVVHPTSYYANLSWEAASDAEGPVSYIVHIIGYLGDNSLGYLRYITKEITMEATGLTKKVEGLYPGKEYTFFVEAVDSAGNKTVSASTTITMVPRYPDGSCDDGEHCFIETNDCGQCPQPIEFYKNDPYYKQFFK